MTRRSITAILGSLVVGLLLVVNAPAVSADGPCILDNQGNCAAREALVSVASIGSLVVVPTIDYRFIENNITNLPDAVTAEHAPVVTSQQQLFLAVNTA